MRHVQLQFDILGAQPRRGPADVLLLDRLRRGDDETLRLLGLVAAARGVSVRMLLHSSRCSADVARSRQLAMYLVHVLLSRTYHEVGQFFGRDRTTVSYACALIEDAREDPRFEAEVAAIEAAFLAEPAAGECHAARC